MILRRTAEIENFDVEMSCSRHGLILRRTAEIGDLVSCVMILRRTAEIRNLMSMCHDSATHCGDGRFDHNGEELG